VGVVTGRLMTTRQVADHLGLSPETVLRRFRDGSIPGYRVASNALRFRESDVEAWLEGRRGLVSVRSEAYRARCE
jgi:excisionase family DNA binding protein